MNDFVPKKKRKARHLKGPDRSDPLHIPKTTPVFPVSLPQEWVWALRIMYPNLSTPSAIRKYIILNLKAALPLCPRCERDYPFGQDHCLHCFYIRELGE